MEIKHLVFTIVSALLVSSCFAPTTPDPEEVISVTGVSLNTSSVSILVNQTYQLEATISPDNASNKNIMYTISDNNVASVSTSGLIRGVSEGSSVITVTTEDGNYKDTCLVNVTSSSSYIPVSDISLNTDNIYLQIGEDYDLIATISPNNATNKEIEFAIEDEDIATIDNNGHIEALVKGGTYITATAKDNGLFAECYLYVSDSAPQEIHVTSVSLNTNNIELTVGDKEKLDTTVLPKNATNKTVAYSSSNNSVASVDSYGQITANAVGNATITVTTNDGGYTATCLVTISETPVIKEARMQDTPILHCWNWSATNIKNHLSEIKEAGFKAVQLSPFQPHKDYYENGQWKNEWWKLYQPLGFTVAQNKQNVLGTKSELTSLCDAAKEMGIDVIMDIVSNHLSDGGGAKLDSNVNKYEPDIYSQNLIHTLNKTVDDSDPERVVRGTIGTLPDLQTETTTVQNRVISLLKEYVDCGVNGFRFDAAKHIETPDDNFGVGKDYSSNFWPNVLNTTTAYAESLGKDAPYYYGEILSSCGTGRSFSSYTKYMSVLDNKQSSNVLNAVTSQNTSLITDEYNTHEKASKLVVWAESHDTYANDERETTDIPTSDIHKAYVIQTSRKDVASLYFARPGNATMGNIGTTDYLNPEIKAINTFHNTFVNQNESLSVDNGCFINVRGGLGAAIVGINNSTNSVTLTIPNIEDGNYTDLVTNNNYVITDNNVTVTLTNGTCILVNKDKSVSTLPELTIGEYSKVYSGTQNISITTKNATSTTYSINNGSETSFIGNTFTLPTSVANGKVTLKIIASNEQGKTYKTITLIKTDSLISKDIIIYDVPETSDVHLCWVWKDNGEGKFVSLEKENNLLGLDMGDNNKFIVVLFPEGTTASNASWGNAKKQSSDITFDKQIFSYLEFGL